MRSRARAMGIEWSAFISQHYEKHGRFLEKKIEFCPCRQMTWEHGILQQPEIRLRSLARFRVCPNPGNRLTSNRSSSANALPLVTRDEAFVGPGDENGTLFVCVCSQPGQAGNSMFGFSDATYML